MGGFGLSALVVIRSKSGIGSIWLFSGGRIHFQDSHIVSCPRSLAPALLTPKASNGGSSPSQAPDLFDFFFCLTSPPFSELTANGSGLSLYILEF